MSDPIARLNQALEGRYQIDRELGEGGMAVVYLAQDLKHNRNVALKVLKPELAAVVGAERFLAEIQVTANLQHPHILPLHDSGEADGFLFYVMPYVEGETLRDRIDREKQLPVDEAVALASKVAGALQHAHEHGVIHRDIKPGNILLQDGEPVVADFGIALAVGAAGSNRLTETGLSLGTPFYMSPEQATGDQAVGASTDTYALGAVLYEMLVGEPPYPGTTAQAVLGRIIAGKPISATEQRPSIPANADAALRKALEKLPADRFTSAQEFVRALGDENFRYGEAAAGVGAGAAGAHVGPWKQIAIRAITVAALTTLGFGWSLLRPDPPRQWEIPRSQQASFGLSPDGTRLALTIVGLEGTIDLWVKQLDTGPLSRVTFGEGNKLRATWSSDSQWLTFVSDRAGDFDVWSKRADGTGTAELVLDWERDVTEALYSADGTLVFRAGLTLPGLGDIYAIRPELDSVAIPLVTTEFEERFIALSPNDRWLAYVSNATGQNEVYVSPFPDAGSARQLVSTAGGTEPVWAHSGRELFYRNAANELVAVQVSEGSSFAWDSQDVLFSMDGYLLTNGNPMYDVSPDDQEFVMLRIGEEGADDSELILIENFFEELKRLVPN